MIKYQKIQALTSHFESFWSIVISEYEGIENELEITIFPFALFGSSEWIGPSSFSLNLFEDFSILKA